MINATKTTDKSPNAGAKAHKNNAIEGDATTLTTANAVRKTSSKATDSVKTLRRFGASSWANKVLVLSDK